MSAYQPDSNTNGFDEEALLIADPRLSEAVDLFNQREWYRCHDGFEALWHETQGPMRPVLQGILQIAVAHLHLERGNQHGALVLLGEALGRLQDCGDQALGLNLEALRQPCHDLLAALQEGISKQPSSFPRLDPFSAR